MTMKLKGLLIIISVALDTSESALELAKTQSQSLQEVCFNEVLLHYIE